MHDSHTTRIQLAASSDECLNTQNEIWVRALQSQATIMIQQGTGCPRLCENKVDGPFCPRRCGSRILGTKSHMAQDL